MTRRGFLSSTSAALAGPAISGIARAPDAAAQVPGDLADLTAAAAVDVMKKGELKAEVYATALLDRAARLSGLNVFRTLDRDRLLEAAVAADRLRGSGAALGLLHGLPIPVKDSVNTVALPTSNGTASLRNFIPKQDAAALSVLFAQGALLMGKTNLHELSFGWTSNNAEFGAVRNPHDQSRVPGGSSGGSAAAVAARIAPLAVGEDTLGSIRVPASMCGVAGLRPSFGRYPGAGIMPLTENKFDQVGPIARSVGDLALFDVAMSGEASAIPPTPLAGVRIGVPSALLEGLDPAVDRSIAAALRKLGDAGAVVVPVDLPASVKAALDIAITVVNYEAMPAISAFLEQQSAPVTFNQLIDQASRGMQGVFKAIALPPNRPSKSDYEAALSQRARLIGDLGKVFEAQGLAALAFPPVLVPPPKIGDESGFRIKGQTVRMYVAMARNTSLASTAGMASLVIPAGMTDEVLPIGIEFAVLPGRDRELLSLGLSVEHALGPPQLPRL